LSFNVLTPVREVSANVRGAPLAVSGSDDGTVKMWDPRNRGAASSMTNKFQVTAVAFGSDGNTIYSGGIDCDIKGWDVRMGEVCSTFKSHTNTVTGLAINAAGTHLLSNGMDHCLRIWDIRPYTQGNRLSATLTGAEHSFEQNLLRCSWSTDGTLVGAGGADCMVHVWDALSGNLRYKLPGHAGAVTDVDFHPKEPIIGSCATDKNIYIGEFSDQ
jgi:Prp8 binding protein